MNINHFASWLIQFSQEESGDVNGTRKLSHLKHYLYQGGLYSRMYNSPVYIEYTVLFVLSLQALDPRPVAPSTTREKSARYYPEAVVSSCAVYLIHPRNHYRI